MRKVNINKSKMDHSLKKSWKEEKVDKVTSDLEFLISIMQETVQSTIIWFSQGKIKACQIVNNSTSRWN
jgi:hypothetical protein